ncbi:MAG: YadA-like family protein [Neisseriaceae bacterium]|nr:YadA-like family protein [Neisseriaceae bacterium]
MNKTFRVIFNHATQQWVAVSELARVNGKHTQSNQNSVSGSLKKAFAPLCLALMGIFFAPMVFADVVGCAQDTGLGYFSCGVNILSTPGKNSLTFGGQNEAKGESSSAFGMANTATGRYSAAFGYDNRAESDNSSAFGVDNRTTAMLSSAFGVGNRAKGEYSSAFGAKSQAIVDYGTAIGYKSYADRAAWDSSSNNYSAAFAPSDMSGFDAKQKAAWQATSAALAVGDPNGTGNSNKPITRQITGVAAGSEDTDAVNVAQLKEVAGMVSGGSSFSPISVSGNTGNFSVGSAGKLNIQGDGTNITTTASGDTVTIGLSSALKTQINTAIATVGTLNTTVTNLGTTVAGLETEIKAVETNVVAYDGRITANKDKITQLENNHNALSGEVTNISNAMANKADQSWVTDQINNAALGGTGVDLSEYAKTADANAYADTAANTAENNAKGYTDSEVAKAKTAANTYADTAANKAKTDAQTYADNAVKDKATQSWVKDEINKAALSGTGMDLSEYAKTADANAYADTAANTAENNAKGYTDSEVAKAKSYADNAANTAETNAKGYTDSKLGDYSTTTDMNKAIDTAKADANKYADTAANKAKTDANAYTDGKLADNATQTWVNNQKFAQQQAVTDLNSRVDKLVVTGGGYEHITVAGENGSFNVANKETAKFVGDGKNITTDASGGEVKISLADDIAVNSVNAGGTVVNQNGVALPSGVALTNGGLNNGGQVISNVAPGVRPTDAVNVSQLNNAMGGVYGRIDSMEKHANAGIAQAMATGAMMTSTQAGQGFLSLSGSTYRGEQGYAMGYSHMSDSGKWGVKFIGSGNSRGKFGGAASVGFRLY